MFVSDKRYYLTAAGKVVEEGDPAAATLLVGEGCELDDATAEKYGLKAKAAASNKAKAPVENKAKTKE